MVNKQERQYATFTDWLRSWGTGVVEPVARFLAQLGLTPNTVTILGALLSISVGGVLALGYIQVSGFLLLLTSLADSFDGTLARMTGKASRFGAFLDSTLDRISDGALLFGLLIWLLPQSRHLEICLVFLAMLGSVMVSYTRARAEGLGFECKVGLFTRVERILTLGIGLMSGWVQLTLVIMTVLVWVTVGQRMWHVWQKAKAEE